MRVIKFEELAEYMASNMNFLIELGEQSGIGSSSLLIRKSGKTILIDRGIAFEGNGFDKITTFPAGGNLNEIYIDLIIWTHVHADHAGLIVPTILAHPESRVILSKKTLEELKIVLADSLSVQRKEATVAYNAGLPSPKVMFTKQDVDTFLARAENEYYQIIDTDNEDVWINWEDWPGLDFGFTFSGHTSGSFMSFVKTPENEGIVITSDVCSHDQENTKGVSMPPESFLEMAEFRKCKSITLVTEATNGNRDREETLEETDARLKAVLMETERRGGVALLPVFMVNRGPNMVSKLVRLGFKVFVAGGVRKTIRTEIDKALLDKWLADGTVMLMENGENYEGQIRAAARGEYGFRPIITSSATLDQGISTSFATYILPVPENTLISTGHRFDGSAMKEFFEIKNKPIGPGHTIVLNGTPVNVRCNGHHFDYSAHDYRTGLIARITALNPDMVFIKHCTEDGFNGLRSAMLEKFGEDCPPVHRASHLTLFEI